MTRLEKENVLRLFQQLHQDIEEDWYRSNGSILCQCCGLPYRDHPTEEFFNTDKRLCDGFTVHL